jgi:hypothetical protein
MGRDMICPALLYIAWCLREVELRDGHTQSPQMYAQAERNLQQKIVWAVA